MKKESLKQKETELLDKECELKEIEIEKHVNA